MTRERVSFVLPGAAAVVSRLVRRMLDQVGLDEVPFSVETERDPAVVPILAPGERRVLSTGRLDGLAISPVGDETGVLFLNFTVDTLPGLRLVLEADAARELRDALVAILETGRHGSVRVIADRSSAEPSSVDAARDSIDVTVDVDRERAELNRVSLLLIAEWERVERRKVNPSYVSTFVDMARVVIADRPRAPEPKEWDAERYDRGDVREDDGYESSDYVDGWNDALAARAQGSR